VHAPLCDRVKEDRVLTEKIRRIQQQVKRRYGSPRMWMELKALGFRCGENRVAPLMRQAGLRARSARQFRVTTPSAHERPTAPKRTRPPVLGRVAPAAGSYLGGGYHVHPDARGLAVSRRHARQIVAADPVLRQGCASRALCAAAY
jgi:transposase InsO family protein